VPLHAGLFVAWLVAEVGVGAGFVDGEGRRATAWIGGGACTGDKHWEQSDDPRRGGGVS
jgi:hypothetical protein